jgi:peptide/nickel transport system permease protein
MFILFKSIPGDPALMLMEGSKDTLNPEQYAKLYEQAVLKLGLNDPLPLQYFKWIGRMMIGDFGYSVYFRLPVADVVKSPMLATSLLNLVNIFFAFSVATIFGISAALRRGKFIDQMLQLVTVIGNSFPSFLICVLLILVFSITLGLTPISGMSTPNFQGTAMGAIMDRGWHMILPVAAMFLSSLGGLTRYVRTNMLEALSMDCIRTARAKGLTEKVVIYSHAFRNALIPIITITSAWFITIFTGSVAIERIFLFNGMGKIMIDALTNKDFAVALAMNMFFTILALVGNLIVDICYGLIDPRIKFE